jgi:hypothetical protein
MHGRIPEPPDIIARSLVVRAGCVEIDTVTAGERFSVSVWKTCWLARSDTRLKTEFFLNEALWLESDGVCDPPLWCTGHGRDGLVLNEPGEYRITVVLDAENVIEEVNESNNSANKILTVVSANSSGRR